MGFEASFFFSELTHGNTSSGQDQNRMLFARTLKYFLFSLRLYSVDRYIYIYIHRSEWTRCGDLGIFAGFGNGRTGGEQCVNGSIGKLFIFFGGSCGAF